MLNFEYSGFSSLSPEISIITGAIIILCVGLILKKVELKKLYLYLAIITLIIAGLFDFKIYDQLPQYSFNGMFVNDFLSVSFKLIVILFSILTIFLSMSSTNIYKDITKFEFPVLILFSIVGMGVMLSANDLITLYLGLELQSLCLYVLASFDRDNLKSSEAGVKYFILGAISSGILLFGMSLVYGYTGTTNFTILTHLYSVIPQGVAIPIAVIIGIILILIGFCFKIAAVPFHVWSPDVYQGAMLPVTAFFTIVPKIAALLTLTKLLLLYFVFWEDIWQQIIIVLAILSMFVGAFAAIKQTDIKRLLAYSSIGHVGYILAALSTNDMLAIKPIIIYVIIYAIMNLGVFALLILVESENGTDKYNLNIFKGLGKTNPILGFSFAVIFLSMAGIPPLAGFFAKFYIIMNLIESQMYILTILVILSSVIAAYYYLKIIKLIYFDEGENEKIHYGAALEAVIVSSFSVAINILLVFTPSAIINLAMLNTILINQ